MQTNRTVAKFYPWIVFLLFALAAAAPVALAAKYASPYGFFRVPFASWLVFCLSGLLLGLDVLGLLLWRRYQHSRQAVECSRKEIQELRRQPHGTPIPAVYGGEHLPRVEFGAIVQILFTPPPEVQYVQVRPLTGGYGGSATVQARLRRDGDAPWLPRSFVVKLGERRELAGEVGKFHNYVFGILPNAPSFFRYAEWYDWAGIAHEFVGRLPGSQILSVQKFYEAYPVAEVEEVLRQAYLDLGSAWYQPEHIEPVDLYQEYHLLSAKQEAIREGVSKLVDAEDPYHVNLSAAVERLQPHRLPRFCPDPDIGWHDPIAFLRTWSRRSLSARVHRSVVHGDLNSRNVLVELGRDSERRVWFIDFSHTGNGLTEARTQAAQREGIPVHRDWGHTLRDFGRLEADIKFMLTPLQSEQDLEMALAFEQALLDQDMDLGELPAILTPSGQPLDERFEKAWSVVRHIRSEAARYLAHAGDLQPYYFSLLQGTLPVVYYDSTQFSSPEQELQQKRYALLAAGMLCNRL